MKASDLFIKCLEEEGVTKIFGIPGEENADFMISLKKVKKLNLFCVDMSKLPLLWLIYMVD